MTQRTRLRSFALAAALLAAVSATLGVAARRAQGAPEARYTPPHRFATGGEVVMVFVATSNCRANKEKGFPAVLERAKVAAARRARAEGKQFRVIAVAIDDDPRVGLRFLRKFGAFDEISLGGNWINHDVVRYVWRDLPYRPGVPQVVVVERQIRKERATIWVSQEREVRRLLGTDEIRRWSDAGAPFTGPLRAAAPAGRS
jgi:hypothetical protein